MRASMVIGLTCALVCAASAQQRSRADDSALNETERIRHALSRFAFGVAVGDIEAVRAQGLDSWFEEQLDAALPETQGLLGRLERLPALSMDGAALLRAYRDPPREERPKRNAAADVRDAVLLRACFGENQLLEVASDFWRNHFNVDAAKGEVQYLLPTWEQDVIRRHALGEFGPLLEATAKHPVMLVYLDNSVSRRPLSKAELKAVEVKARVKSDSKTRGLEAAAIAAQRGLNENYARELLELHTLGVDRYYSQRDVIEVAKILTGWTVQLDSKTGVGFRFDADRHCRGEKWFLGSSIRASSANPVAEGEEVLRRLVRHPGTGEFLAWKLCRFFVDDDPPEKMVARIAAVFRRTKGDLRATYRAIFEDAEFFAPRLFQAKFKRPFEFVVSALRVTGAEVKSTRALHEVLTDLSEPLYRCEDPTGYYDQAEAWRDPGVMAVRWRFAMDLAANRIKGVQIPASFYADLHPRIRRAWRDQLALRILPAGMSPLTARVIDARIQRYLEDRPAPTPRELGPLIVGLLIGCPEFQRQ